MSKDTSWRQISSLYIGTVIGAGFATGQEILQFFANYGYKGILGIVVSTILFISVAVGVLLKVHNNNLKNYQELIVPVMGKKLSLVVEFVILSYLFIGACVMVSGSGALFKEQFNMSYDLGLVTMILLTFFTVIHSVEGVLKANAILIPILLIGIITIGVSVFIKKDLNFEYLEITSTNSYNWLTSAIMYVSYNIISAIVVLASLASVMKTKKTARKAGLMGGLGLGILSLFIILPLLLLFNDVKDLEIPMLGVARYLVKKGDLFYSFLIWIAMFTTVVSNSFGFIRRICDIININFKIIAVIFCLATIPVAKMGFARLVNVFYPLFGYLSTGLIFIFIIISIYKKTTSKISNLKR